MGKETFLVLVLVVASFTFGYLMKGLVDHCQEIRERPAVIWEIPVVPYEKEVVECAHRYHGILVSRHDWEKGEHTFERAGDVCKLFKYLEDRHGTQQKSV